MKLVDKKPWQYLACKDQWYDGPVDSTSYPLVSAATLSKATFCMRVFFAPLPQDSVE